MSGPHALEVQNVSKRYGSPIALDDVSLRVERGRFITSLGPSGSGETTPLMMIAGFVAPDTGAPIPVLSTVGGDIGRRTQPAARGDPAAARKARTSGRRRRSSRQTTYSATARSASDTATRANPGSAGEPAAEAGPPPTPPPTPPRT